MGGYGGGKSTTTTSTIHIGNVVLDMYRVYEPGLERYGIQVPRPEGHAGKGQNNTDKAGAKLMKKYPPPAEKS
jgi:hypothetical protein